MSETALRVDAPSVADHRPVPTGVFPRGMQTWVMLGVAVGMLAIILFAGRREPAARIADAAVRASVRASGAVGQPAISTSAAPVAAAQAAPTQSGSGSAQRVIATDPISDGGLLHRILEGTVVDTVLTNRLDGGSSSPVN